MQGEELDGGGKGGVRPRASGPEKKGGGKANVEIQQSKEKKGGKKILSKNGHSQGDKNQPREEHRGGEVPGIQKREINKKDPTRRRERETGGGGRKVSLASMFQLAQALLGEMRGGGLMQGNFAVEGTEKGKKELPSGEGGGKGETYKDPPHKSLPQQKKKGCPGEERKNVFPYRGAPSPGGGKEKKTMPRLGEAFHLTGRKKRPDDNKT